MFCSSWRSISKQDRKRFRPVLPGIITREEVAVQNRFESLSKLKLGPSGRTTIPSGFPSNSSQKDGAARRRRPKRKTPEKCVCGSHQGWILMKEPHQELVLTNPVTQVRFQLPRHFGGTRTRFTFSANPTDDERCYIIASNPVTPLQCCKLRDVEWTDVEIPDKKTFYFGFVDAIYYRGKLYVLRRTGELFVCDDITASPPMMTKLVNTPQYSPATTAELLLRMLPGKLFLVESGQELLLACCKDRHRLSKGFEVYRLDIGSLRWDRVTNLGEHALFLGMNQPFSLSELEVRGIKGNHIYYIENLSDLEEDSRKEICVFSLEKSSIQYLTTEFPVEEPRGIWFTPQL